MGVVAEGSAEIVLRQAARLCGVGALASPWLKAGTKADVVMNKSALPSGTGVGLGSRVPIVLAKRVCARLWRCCRSFSP